MHNLQIPRTSVPQNTRFLRTRFYVQERPSSVGVLQPYFKSSKGISPTSLRCGVLTRFPSSFFSTIRSTRENEGITTNKLHTRTTFHVSSTKNSFFGSRVAVFHKQPVLFEESAPTSLFLQGSHIQRQSHKRTTLSSESSTM